MPIPRTFDSIDWALWFFLISAFVLFGVYVWRGIRTSAQVTEIQAQRDYAIESSPKPAVRESLFAAFLCWSVCMYATNVYVQRAFSTATSSVRVTFLSAADLSTGHFSPPVSVSFYEEWDGELWSAGSHYYSPPDRARVQLHTSAGFKTIELSARSDAGAVFDRVRDALVSSGDEILAEPIASAAIKFAGCGVGESYDSVFETLRAYKRPLESTFPTWSAADSGYTIRRASWVAIPCLVAWSLGVAVMYRRQAMRDRAVAEDPTLNTATSVRT